MRFLIILFLQIPPLAFASEGTDLIAAHDAFLAKDTSRLDRYAQRLEHTPLDVYAEYYRLHLQLEKIGQDPVPADVETSVRRFLARPQDTPLIDVLRLEWLKLLGKQRLWTQFDAEYPRVVNHDDEVDCYALQSLRRSEELSVLFKARELWFNGKSQPESCGNLFDLALAADVITEHDVVDRLRLALEAVNIPLALKLAQMLDGTYPRLSSALQAAAANPNRYTELLTLDKLAEGQRIVTLFALQRVAKQSTQVAAERWEKVADFLPMSERKYFYSRLGYEAARNLDDRALQWYRAGGDTPLTDQQKAWRVRAALRTGDWREVLSAINTMGASQQHESAWIYWKARALQALGRDMEARALLAPLSSEYSFYGLLAGEELPDVPILSEDIPAYKPDRKQIEAVEDQPGVRRTIALYRAGLRNDALEEWRWALRNLNDQELLAAAEIARRNEMYDRAIGAADMTTSVHDFSMRYLAPYRTELQDHIQKHNLDEAWVYGLMRQESRFATSAKSEAGASGVMQIMPDTARWVAKKLGLKSYRNNLIHQLDTNLRIGTYYMKTIFAQSESNPVLASAAYNAGPARALQWRADRPLEGAIYAETIPYEETREYVKKVMSNTAFYASEFNTPPRSFKQRLGIVPANASTSQQASMVVRDVH